MYSLWVMLSKWSRLDCDNTGLDTKCDDWASNGKCTNPTYAEYMEQNCRKSCGFCGK